MEKLSKFYREHKGEIGVSYLTFKKYIFENLEKYNEVFKIIDNDKRKTYYVTNKSDFLRIFKD